MLLHGYLPGSAIPRLRGIDDELMQADVKDAGVRAGGVGYRLCRQRSAPEVVVAVSTTGRTDYTCFVLPLIHRVLLTSGTLAVHVQSDDQ